MYQYQVSNPVQQPLSGCHLVSVYEPWAQLCFVDVHHREHLFTKIYRTKHAQNFCSKGCHFGVAWNKILIECVQARQGKLGLQIWITLQVNYFKLQVNGLIRGFYCEWRTNDLETTPTFQPTDSRLSSGFFPPWNIVMQQWVVTVELFQDTERLNSEQM